MTAISKRQLATVIAGGAALSLVVGCIGTLVGTDAVASARLGARYTGRLSFVLFAALFALGPQRGDAGVRSAILGWPGLASAHLVHLGFLLRYLSMAEHTPAPGRLAGGVAFATLLRRRLGRRRASQAVAMLRDETHAEGDEAHALRSRLRVEALELGGERVERVGSLALGGRVGQPPAGVAQRRAEVGDAVDVAKAVFGREAQRRFERGERALAGGRWTCWLGGLGGRQGVARLAQTEA